MCLKGAWPLDGTAAAAADECLHQGCSLSGLQKLNIGDHNDGSSQHESGGTFHGVQWPTNTIAFALFISVISNLKASLGAAAWPFLGRCRQCPGTSVTVSSTVSRQSFARAHSRHFASPRYASKDQSWHFKVMAAREPVVTCTHLPGIFRLHFDTSQLGPQGCLRRLER